MSTEKQVQANRLNAQRSTGPCTETGREQSKRNSVRHGLAGSGLVLPESMRAAVARREALWFQEDGRGPATERERYLVHQIVLESVRIEVAQGEQADLEEETRRRAAESWEEDRQLAAVEIAKDLERSPEQTVHRLKQTAQGCDWLIRRWLQLAQMVQQQQQLTGLDARVLYDLIGLHRDGRAVDDTVGEEQFETIANQHVAALTELRDEVLNPRDLREMERAIRGAGWDSPEYRRLRRYEAESYRRMKTAERELAELQAKPRPDAAQPVQPPTTTQTASADQPAPSREKSQAAQTSKFWRSMREKSFPADTGETVVKAESETETGSEDHPVPMSSDGLHEGPTASRGHTESKPFGEAAA
jgi:hypothetical protein